MGYGGEPIGPQKGENKVPGPRFAPESWTSLYAKQGDRKSHAAKMGWSCRKGREGAGTAGGGRREGAGGTLFPAPSLHVAVAGLDRASQGQQHGEKRLWTPGQARGVAIQLKGAPALKLPPPAAIIRASGKVRDGMKLTVNGEEREVTGPMTVLGLVESFGLAPQKIAVERNLEIVPRSAYGDVALRDGDRIEIVNFVGGG